MESSPPLPVGPGQRMLAAIVFTDTVSFSARVQDEEEVTLKLLERDFAVMRKLCAKHEGAVLKTTGDGLLLHFSSAVLAVAYALKMQRHFADRAKNTPADDHLTHRVGIHLGDVFVNDDDVMGDGVNIAARLQAEAEPGGICISQTVYDVVKNKLELAVVKLAPRELKNISQAVPMYRVLLEPPKPGAGLAEQAARSFPSPAAPPPFSLTRTQKVAAVMLLAVGLVVAAGLVVRMHLEHEDELARGQATRAEIGARLGERVAHPGTPAGAPATAAGTAAANSSPRPEYNFAAMTRNQPAENAGSSGDEALIRQQADQGMQALFTWMDAAISRYSRDSPLLVRELSGTISQETKIFGGADHRVYLAEGGAIRQRNWAELKPANLGAVITSVLLASPVPPPHEVIQGAEAFAYLYGLPEVNEALRAGRLGGAQK